VAVAVVWRALCVAVSATSLDRQQRRPDDDGQNSSGGIWLAAERSVWWNTASRQIATGSTVSVRPSWRGPCGSNPVNFLPSGRLLHSAQRVAISHHSTAVWHHNYSQFTYVQRLQVSLNQLSAFHHVHYNCRPDKL